MDYGEVLSKAWKIIWKHKVLWIFGILASFGQGSGGGSGGSGGNSGVSRWGKFIRFWESASGVDALHRRCPAFH